MQRKRQSPCMMDSIYIYINISMFKIRNGACAKGQAGHHHHHHRFNRRDMLRIIHYTTNRFHIQIMYRLRDKLEKKIYGDKFNWINITIEPYTVVRPTLPPKNSGHLCWTVQIGTIKKMRTSPFSFTAPAAQTGRGRGLKFFMEVHLGTTTGVIQANF